MSRLPNRPNRYRPRKAWFVKHVDCGPVGIKLSAISAPTAEIRETDIARAEDVIRVEGAKLAGRSGHTGAGFAIIHAGEEALWLLLHQWIEGGIATQRLWRAPLGTEALFEPDISDSMACVWELGVIDFERKAWMSTVMSGKRLSDYLALTLPYGTV